MTTYHRNDRNAPDARPSGRTRYGSRKDEAIADAPIAPAEPPFGPHLREAANDADANDPTAPAGKRRLADEPRPGSYLALRPRAHEVVPDETGTATLLPVSD